MASASASETVMNDVDILECIVCDDFKTNNLNDLESHVLQEHKEANVSQVKQLSALMSYMCNGTEDGDRLYETMIPQLENVIATSSKKAENQNESEARKALLRAALPLEECESWAYLCQYCQRAWDLTTKGIVAKMRNHVLDCHHNEILREPANRVFNMFSCVQNTPGDLVAMMERKGYVLKSPLIIPDPDLLPGVILMEPDQGVQVQGESEGDKVDTDDDGPDVVGQ